MELVPDLVIWLTTAPPARPYSAVKLEVWKETSWMASLLVMEYCGPAIEMSLFWRPSIRKLLDRARAPLTAPMPLSREPLWFDRTTPGAVRIRLSEFWFRMGSSARAVAGMVEPRTASSVCSSVELVETSTVAPTELTVR